MACRAQTENNVLMPMSNLFLFGRSQDYGYAMADSVSRVTRRHHLRIRKTDYEMSGYPVWVAAGTHDIGVERDKRKWAITHKIDPDVDGERDFIEHVPVLVETGGSRWAAS